MGARKPHLLLPLLTLDYNVPMEIQYNQRGQDQTSLTGGCDLGSRTIFSTLAWCETAMFILITICLDSYQLQHNDLLHGLVRDLTNRELR